MSDSRRRALARTVIRRSTRLQPGEAMLIDAYDADPELVAALVDEAYEVDGLPLVQARPTAAVARSNQRTSATRRIHVPAGASKRTK